MTLHTCCKATYAWQSAEGVDYSKNCSPVPKISVLQKLWHARKRLDFGFLVINGSHHIYIHTDIPELVNLQNVNGQAKPYQVKQLLRLIERYNLQMEERP